MTTTKDPLAMLRSDYGDRPPLPRYESEPIILDSLNDSAAAGSDALAKAFAIQNERIAANAYRIYE